MLEIDVAGREYWDSVKEEFVNTKGLHLRLEHSLISVSKWEAKYKRPFITDGPKTPDETYDYIADMSLDKIADKTVLYGLTETDYNRILEYINDPMTATKINDPQKKKSKPHALTNEEIYYYMTALNIPFSCEKWHLNRLLTLIDVASIKNQPPKKMSKGDIARQNAALNAARRAKHHSAG